MQEPITQDAIDQVSWYHEFDFGNGLRTKPTLEIDFHRPVGADQEITITSFVREFHGPDAMIECTMTDAAGTTVATCLMIVAHVDARTRRATDWPPEHQALFFEPDD